MKTAEASPPCTAGVRGRCRSKRAPGGTAICAAPARRRRRGRRSGGRAGRRADRPGRAGRSGRALREHTDPSSSPPTTPRSTSTPRSGACRCRRRRRCRPGRRRADRVARRAALARDLAGRPLQVREAAAAVGGHATRFRAHERPAGAFTTPAPPLLAIHQRLKRSFDPHGILNPGRLFPACDPSAACMTHSPRNSRTA